MTRILIFMVVTLFLYIFFLKYHHISLCPRCGSNKVTIENLDNYKLFTCHTCRFSYKDYYLFFNLTPINEQLDIEFIQQDEDNDEDDIEE
ncbi:hypothetical protein KQI88_01040 [Alkaliphilus sp. MSJ-5]|uniref:Uncharacterized protein n=1 Tax=Alkaliphilus flagellatus TaxID=2841507 RepID=A0ABS6G0Z8_9FIRM|nr:hypothetical protein [Alkaliphilus flagellatus]MBU5675001.1 hypothetical protein [Alkaliphilus flagellatus]